MFDLAAIVVYCLKYVYLNGIVPDGLGRVHFGAGRCALALPAVRAVREIHTHTSFHRRQVDRENVC